MRSAIYSTVIYLFLAFLFTYPAVLNPFENYYGGFPSDGTGAVVSFTRYAGCIRTGADCSVNMMQNAPWGVRGGSVFESLFILLGTSITYLLGPVFALNFLVWAGFVFAGIAMYALAFHVTKDAKAAFIAGLIFGFSPWMFVRSLGQLSIVMGTGFLPLAIWRWLRLRDELNLRNAAYAALATGVGAYIDISIAFIAAVMLAGFLAYLFIWKKSRDALAGGWKHWLVFFIAIALLWFPVFFKFGGSVNIGSSYLEQRYFGELLTYGARPWDFILPSAYHPIFGPVVSQFVQAKLHGSNIAEQTLFLGYLPMLLSAIALVMLWKNREDRFAWLLFPFLALIALSFSIGPYIPKTPIPMPPLLVYQFLPSFRTYVRFGVVAYMAVAVLSAYVLARLVRQRFFVSGPVITAAVAALVLFEFTIVPPFHADYHKPAPVYVWLAQQLGNDVVVEYPLMGAVDGRHLEYLFWQDFHHKPLFNGAVDAEPEGIRQEVEDVPANTTAGILSFYGVKYAIVHGDIRPGNGFYEVARFGSDAVYGINATPPRIFTYRGLHFNKIEWMDGRRFNYIENHAEQIIMNQGDAMNATLRFYAIPYENATMSLRNLRVNINNETAQDFYTSQEWNEYSLDATLRPGRNVVTFISLDGVSVHKQDYRTVSYAISEFRVEER